MNFHKTIGFLATLLLTLGLGVPDSFAQTVKSVDLSVSKDSFMDTDDGTAVTLTTAVTMSGNVTAATTVSVALVDSTTTSITEAMRADAGDYTLGNLTFGTTAIEVIIPKGSNTASKQLNFIFDPAEDDAATDISDEMIAIGGAATTIDGTAVTGTPKTDVVKLTITDTDNSVSMVDLSVDTDSFLDTADGTPVVLTASVTMKKNAAAATTVSVALVDSTTTSITEAMRAEAGDYTLSNLELDTSTLSVIIPKGSMRGSKQLEFILDPATDAAADDTADEMIAIGGVTVLGGKTDTDVVKLTITDTDNSVSMVDLSVDTDSFLDTADGTPVVLTASVTMKKNAAAATTVTVTLVDSTATSIGEAMRAEAGDYALTNLTFDTSTIEVVIPKGSMRGSRTHSFILDPAEDNAPDTVDEMIAIGGVTTFGGKTDTDVVTLTITDTDNSVSMVELSADTDSFMDTDDGTPVTLTASVTLKNNAAAATTVTVTLVDSTATSVKKAADRAALTTDYTLSNLELDTSTIEVVIPKGSMTASRMHSFILDPATDAASNTANEVIAIGGVTDPGGKTDVVTLTITDSDRPVPGAVTGLELSPDMLSLTEGMAFTGTVTVTLTVAGGAATTHNVEWSAGGANLADLGITSSTAVAIPQDAPSGTGTLEISYTPPEDDNSDGETITITGTVGDQSDDLTLNIADNDMGAVTSVELSPDMLSLTEGMEFTGMVTVTVNAVAGPAQTVSVAFSSETPLPLGTINSSISVVIPQDAPSGTANVSISYTPMEDDNSANEMIVITATGGGQSDDLTLNITDNDMGAVTGVEFSPDMLSLTEGMAATETVTVTVNVVAGAVADHEVALSVDSGMLADLGITSSTVTVPVAAGESSGMATIDISYTPPTDADLDDEMMTVTGMTGGQSGTLTLNVADNTVSQGTIKVSTSLESIRENSRTRNVVVTATLDAAPGAGNTVVVMVEVEGGTAPVMTQIPISGSNTEGTATVAITPVNDDVFTTKSFTVTGKVTGYESGMAEIDIVDDDASMGTLSFSAISPPSATLNGGAQTLALTVQVWLASPDTPIPNPLVVNVMSDKGTLASQTVSITNIRKHPDHDPATRKADGTGKVNLSLTAADVNAAGNITVTASADMYETGTRTIPIRARGALDVAGYRAVIAKPTGTAWANVGNDKIFVDVTRHGNVAYPWADFGSIKVSVRDTAHGVHEIETVTASGFNREDNGAVTFEEPGSTSRGDVIWKGNDLIRFEIRIRGYDANRDPAANGQYLGAYAHVEFTSGRETAAIETRDSDTSVYPADPSLVNNAKVGDGRLIRIDNKVPDHSGVGAIRVTSGDEVGGNIDATVGDEIRVAVKLSQTNLFRESGLRIQLQVVDGTGSVKGQTLTAAQRNNPSKNKDFSASQVIAAASDSLIHTYTVTEGFFTVTLDDFVEGVGAKATKLDLNNARARVRAGVKDQAANFKWSGWTTFDIDSRSPSVSILYPSADPDSIYEHTHPMRFSGANESIVEGQNQDAHLNPLAILVDEDLSALKVYAVGADTLDLFNQIPSNVIGDSTAVYDTRALSSLKKDGEGDDDKYPGTDFVPSSANRAGTEIELAVLATDVLGNTTKTTISGVTHDASPPVITDWFPKNSLLPDGQINDATPPVFTLPEDVDSIAVTFEGSDGSDVTKQRGGVTTKGEDSIDFSGALKDEISYAMTIFVRDLAGNVFITPADSSANMRFNAQFDNPVANRFKISTETDSVIAGQANILTIQAEDHDAGVTRNALTYKNAVRISALGAEGGAVESVWFEGTGVDDDADNPDGMAMLSAADWRIGKRSVTVKSNMAVDYVKILVQHISSGMGDTAVLGFESAKDSLHVGAADFAAFDITAWEEGVEGAVQEIWGNYTLRVVPVDRHGNPSVRAFKADPAGDDADSLDVLDTRVKDNAFEYKNGLDVEIIGVPTIEDFALLILSVEKEGANYDLVAPDDRRTQTVQVRVANESLKEGDSRSQNVRSSAKFNIRRPPMLALTLWVPGSDMDEAGNDVVIPADAGTITVTVRAEGFNEGDMVTFTRNGTAMDPVAADADGYAPLMITATMASTTTVSAMSGRYSTDELTITFTDAPAEPARKSYVDANGDPVYLISDADMTVGVDDFLALVAAFGSSDGDDNYNAQADVDDNGMVEVADFLEFVTSYGRTAVGPATKPLVLLPGINENAEFSLSLGSERVVAGELVAVDVSLANVAALIGYGFALNYETDKFEFISVAPADEDLLKSTGGETLFHHIVSDGQITVANGLYNGTAVSGGGDAVQFVFRVLREFEDNARFEIADGLVFDPSQLQNPAVVAGVLELQSTPREFALHQNFPNPFNPDTTIKYDLAESADVTLQIYNVLGQVVRTLVASEAQNAGRYQIRWNGMDDRGVPVSSGIYFYQISADGKFSDVRKLMLLK